MAVIVRNRRAGRVWRASRPTRPPRTAAEGAERRRRRSRRPDPGRRANNGSSVSANRASSTRRSRAGCRRRSGPVDRAEHRHRVERVHEGARSVVDGLTGDRHVVGVHHAVHEADQHPPRHQRRLRRDDRLEQREVRVLGVRGRGVVPGDRVVGQPPDRSRSPVPRGVLEAAHPQVTARHPGQHRAGQRGLAVYRRPVATTASARVVGMPSACIASLTRYSRSIGPTAARPSPPRANGVCPEPLRWRSRMGLGAGRARRAAARARRPAAGRSRRTGGRHRPGLPARRRRAPGCRPGTADALGGAQPAGPRPSRRRAPR